MSEVKKRFIPDPYQPGNPFAGEFVPCLEMPEAKGETRKEYLDKYFKCGDMPTERKLPGCGRSNWKVLYQPAFNFYRLICRECGASTLIEWGNGRQ